MTGSDGALLVTTELAIPWRELAFRATPGGGPGGQHVNRSATRIELWWNVRESTALSDEQRALLEARLARRLDRQGRLRLVSDARRSQSRNREAAVERLVKVLAAALHVAPPRKRTRPTRSSVERRLGEKKRRSDTKRARQHRADDE